jgi:excisionase family DNA binding protein
MSEFLTTADLQKILHVSPQSIRSLARSGRLEAGFVLGRWLFKREDVERFVASSRRGR